VQNTHLLIEPHFFPCLAYFSYLIPYSTLYLSIGERYQKQSYCNRCYILGSQRIERLTIPVTNVHRDSIYQEIKIDYNQRWALCHWRAICTAYNKAPYFEYFADYFYSLFRLERHTYLWELNIAILQTCIKLLNWEKTIYIVKENTMNMINFATDAKNLIRPHINTYNQLIYEPYRYQQAFGKTFHANLSILDLLFCTGLEASNVLKKSFFLTT